MTLMTRSEISDAFVARGWVARQGNFFFDGRGGSLHPHLHMMLASPPTVRTGRDIRMAVGMLAWSDGQQHRGGGGQTFIQGGQVTQRDWRMRVGGVNGGMADELAWIMDYFANG